MDWKTAIGESVILYKRHLSEYVRLSLMFAIGALMAFGAPLFLSVVVFALTTGLSIPHEISTPLNIITLVFSFVIGIATYAAIKSAYYAGIFEIYNRGGAHALNYFSFARRHFVESATCEILITLVPLLAITPLILAGIMMRSQTVLAISMSIFFVFLTVANYISLFTYPALVIDGYGPIISLKKSIKTTSENKRDIPPFFMLIWIAQMVILLIPMLGQLIYALVLLPISATAVTVFYRSKRRI